MTEWHPLRSPNNDGDGDEWTRWNELAEERARISVPAEMPSMSHASMRDFDHVYEPSDDTYLLLDAIRAEHYHHHWDDDDDERKPGGGGATTANNNDPPVDAVDAAATTATTTTGRGKRRSGLVVMEIGTGSGVPITYLASLLGGSSGLSTSCVVVSAVFATDVNRVALDLAKKTATENGVRNLELVQCDLAGPLLSQCRHGVDVLIFNPPYVPTPDGEVPNAKNHAAFASSGDIIEASWAGGHKGRRVIDRAVPQIAQLLSRPDGVAYMVTVDDNEPEELAITMREDHALNMVPLLRRRARNEFLTVQKITWA